MAEAATIYGIKNCDTMKKARAWLEGRGVAHAFHDYKAAGIERARLEGWAREVGWEVLLNRSGTTFRKLPEADKAGLDGPKAIALMQAQPSMIRRPVLEAGGRCWRPAAGCWSASSRTRGRRHSADRVWRRRITPPETIAYSLFVLDFGAALPHHGAASAGAEQACGAGKTIPVCSSLISLDKIGFVS